MKKLIIAIILCGTIPFASASNIFATLKNNAGGEIVLLSITGNCKNRTQAVFTRASTGVAIWGCWIYLDTYVFATYQNGMSRVYPVTDFTLNPDYSKKTKKKVSKSTETLNDHNDYT